MRLPEVQRQVLAGGTAALAFLALFFGIDLVWWVAALGAGLVFLASLLIVARKRDAAEIKLAGHTSAADIQQAGKLMERAAERLDAAAERLPQHAGTTLLAMIDHLQSIRSQVLADPKDYRRARRFITFYLGEMVDTVEQYADLHEKTRGRHEERLAPLAQRIESFLPTLQKIDAACLENDFVALEAQVGALEIQMRRG